MGERSNRRLPLDTLKHAHSLLNDVTPLKTDCGELCDRICCKGLDEHAGMYLFLGEEALYAPRSDWYTLSFHDVSEHEFCPEWEGTVKRLAFLECEGSCPRKLRPLACKLFPLAAEPVAIPIGASGAPDYRGDPKQIVWDIRVVTDFDAALFCPLARHARLEDLDPRFVLRCQQVYTLLARDPLILADLKWQAQRRKEDAAQPWARLL